MLAGTNETKRKKKWKNNVAKKSTSLNGANMILIKHWPITILMHNWGGGGNRTGVESIFANWWTPVIFARQQTTSWISKIVFIHKMCFCCIQWSNLMHSKFSNLNGDGFFEKNLSKSCLTKFAASWRGCCSWPNA